MNLPHAPMAEKAVLSCMFKSHSWLGRAAAEGINGASFYAPAHRIIYDALQSAGGKYHLPEDFDLIGFIQQLSLDGLLDRAGGASAIVDVHGYAFTPGGWSGWVEQLKETRAMREAAAAAVDIAAASTPQEAIGLVSISLDTLRKTLGGTKRAKGGKEAAAAFMAQFMEDHQRGEIPGASTGIGEIDELSGGMRPGDLWVIGGKSSAGKSVMMLQIASAPLTAGGVVAVFTLEMMEREIIGRLISCCGNVRFGAITQPRTASKYDLDRINSHAAILGKSHLWIDDSPGQNVDTVATEAERIRDMEGRIDLIVVDYLQLMRGGRGRNESREEEVARASGGLKQLAKRLKCPVLTASQLNEDGKTRESRAIIQDADAALFICDDGLLIGKLRNGKRDDVIPLWLDGAHQRFQPNRPQ